MLVNVDRELNEPWAFLVWPGGRMVPWWDSRFVEEELRQTLEEVLAEA